MLSRDHTRPGPQMSAQRAASRFDVAQVWCAVSQRRWHRNDGHIEFGEIGSVGGGLVAGGERSGERLVADVANEALSGAQRGDPLLRNIETNHVEADLDRAHRDWQADITLTNDNHFGRTLPQALYEITHLVSNPFLPLRRRHAQVRPRDTIGGGARGHESAEATWSRFQVLIVR